MYFHLILTDDCNLCCSYCRAKAFEDDEEPTPGENASVEVDLDLSPDLNYDLELLYRFLGKDPAPTLTFYGGEPLLRCDLIKTIMRSVPDCRFMIQTNGILLDRLDPELVNRFSTILVSLDGKESLTDANRGVGVYRRVMKNIQKIHNNGYRGELIARITVTEHTDIVDAIHYLSDNPDYSFSSIHWQIDANFSPDFSHRHFAEWVNDSYNPGIRTLVQEWVDHMQETAEVLHLYPFIDPMEDLLVKKPSLLRCGSGHENYTILTDGHIVPCPVMIGMKQYYLGHIAKSNPLELPVVPVGGECISCKIRSFCGGRCLYSNITQPWSAAHRQLVCKTVENLHDALFTALPRVRALIHEGKITLSSFAHEKFNGCEIIP
jgi:putative peptide-modifying radical SAM enzyme